jgi:outer membrane murein-binding lipoprotein Lpp
MKWFKLAAVVAGAGLLGACQTAHSDSTGVAAPEAEATPDLSERLAALEEQVADARVAVEAAEARAEKAERRAAATRLPRAAATPAPRAAEPVRVASADPERLPAPRPAYDPTPRPTPEPRIIVARGTRLELDLETPLSSSSNRVGDAIVARVSSAVSPEGDVALPGGAWLEGRLTEVKASGRVSGRARLTAHFDTLVVRGERHSIDTTDLVLEAENGHKRDAAVVGGGAAAGAIIGGIAGGKGGLGKGILIGGAAGTAAVLATPGKDVELPAGARISLETLTTLRL